MTDLVNRRILLPNLPTNPYIKQELGKYFGRVGFPQTPFQKARAERATKLGGGFAFGLRHPFAGRVRTSQVPNYHFPTSQLDNGGNRDRWSVPRSASECCPLTLIRVDCTSQAHLRRDVRMAQRSDTESVPQHTPGPWRVIEAGGFWVVPGMVAFDHGTPDITIIPIPLDNEANAALIAAVPDLLAGNEQAIHLLELVGLTGSPVYAALKSAAAKAEGRDA